MKLNYWLVSIGLCVLSSSCVSNYVVSTNAYNPDSKLKQHLTVNGVKIPKANLSYKNQFKVEDTFEEVQLPVEGIDNIVLNDDSFNKPISYKAYSVIEEAKTYLGTPYKWGGSSRYGIDCSAFTQKVFGSNDIWLPRVAHMQAHEGRYVDKSELQKGDLLFFITRGRSISHVGIVESVSPEGEIRFIHASSSNGVCVSTLDNDYWARKFQFAKRVI